MKVNCLYMPMHNEYGSNYGTERIDFPEREVDPEILADELPDSILKDDIVRGEFNRLTWKSDKEKQNEIIRSQLTNDVWNQFKVYDAFSLYEAIKRYYEDF